LHLLDKFKSSIVDVIGKTFHHIGAAPWISNLPKSQRNNGKIIAIVIII